VGMARLLRTLLFLSLLLVPARAHAADKLTDLIHRADHVLRGKTTAALLKMHVHTKSYDRSYSMVYWADERGGKDRALIKVLGPARWRGHGTLKVENRLSLYDPSSDRVTVLSSSMLGDNWMGSHFTNDDLVKETDLAKDYRPHLLKTWTKGSARYYRVRLNPTPQAPVAWDHITVELYQEGSNVIPTRQEYFRRAKQKHPTRTMTLREVKEMGGRMLPTKLVMRVAAKPGEYTSLSYEKLKFDANVPSSKFTEQALRN
jgi:uncharacterized protein with von Willebrand factor type A (vWA) domain